jgi:hypothetical protein
LDDDCSKEVSVVESLIPWQTLRTELQRHAQKLATNPAEWMPWNYRETLERIVSR